MFLIYLKAVLEKFTDCRELYLIHAKMTSYALLVALNISCVKVHFALSFVLKVTRVLFTSLSLRNEIVFLASI